MKRIVSIFFLSLLALACRENPAPELPMPEFTGFSVDATYETAVITVEHQGDYGIVEAGIYLEDRRILADDRESGQFTVTVAGLEGSTDYNYKAFVSNGIHEAVSPSQTFRTAPAPKVIRSGEGTFTIHTENTPLADILQRNGVDPEEIVHLTLIGHLADEDFPVIRKKMKLLESLDLGKTDVTVMPYLALATCNFTSLVLPEGLVEVGKCAVTDCQQMQGALKLPKGLKIVGIDGFSNGYMLESLELPDGIQVIKDCAFMYCISMGGELILPQSLTEIGERAFYGTDFRGNLTIPSNVKSILFSTFMEVGFEGELFLHDGITEIGPTAFAENGFKGVLTLPASLKHLGEGAFLGNQFSGDIVIPETIKEIPNDVFADGSFMQQYSRVILHKEVQSIGERAFFEFDNVLQEVVCYNEEPPRYATDAFNPEAIPSVTLRVPEGAVQRYREAEGWKDFGSILPIE